MNKKFNKVKCVSQINFSKIQGYYLLNYLGQLKIIQKESPQEKKHNQHIVSVESVHNNDY